MKQSSLVWGMLVACFFSFYACTAQSDAKNDAADNLIKNEYSAKIEEIRNEWKSLWLPYHEEKDRQKKNNLFQNITFGDDYGKLLKKIYVIAAEIHIKINGTKPGKVADIDESILNVVLKKIDPALKSQGGSVEYSAQS